MRRRRRAIRRRRRPSRRGPWIVAVAAALLAFGIGFVLGSRRQAEPAPGGGPAAPAVSDRAPSRPAGPPPSRPEAEPEPAPAYVAAEGARVALVIDDLGRRVEDVADLAALGVPMSYSVLPFESRTAEVVAALRRRGAEILCHLPMESKTGADPGPGALERSMTPRQLAAATSWALAAVDGAVGANNHMGSELSTDRRAMRPILGELAQRDLFFLDSRTSPESVGFRLAVELGVPAAERQVFLDVDPRPEAIAAEFRRLLERAHADGAAIAIGHPHAETLTVLRQEIPRALAAGYEFVPVSYLLERRGAGAPL